MKDLVKICGLARREDVAATLETEPDAMGFIFWPKSPRGVSAAEVRAWTGGRMRPPVRKVGVFVDSGVEEIEAVAREADLDVVQLHGPYSADQIRQITLPVWRVLHADRLPSDWNQVPVDALLLDSGTVEMPGGTGVRVDADRARDLIAQSKFPVLLAGGLKADNVRGLIQKVQPAGVDVSSGVESKPGHKNMSAVRAFIRNARQAFQSQADFFT